jgi:hypothetical protein
MKKKQKQKRVIFDSMKAAAARLKIDLGLVQFAKNKGCEAFRGSRVNIDELERWLADNADLVNSRPTISREDVDLKLRQLKLERDTLAKDRERFEFEQIRGRFIAIDDVTADLGLIGRTISAAIAKEFIQEVPARLVGLTEPEIREALRTSTVNALQFLHERQAWYSTAEKQ